MKTKNLPITTLILAAMFAIICYSSCSKHTDCINVMTGFNPFIYLQINNSLNKNLLDPATTGHYDTAMIKKLNGDKIQLSKPGAVPVTFQFNYNDVGTRTISLNATDQDIFTVVTATNAQGCTLTTQLQAVKYNGVTLTADGSLYIAHK